MAAILRVPRSFMWNLKTLLSNLGWLAAYATSLRNFYPEESAPSDADLNCAAIKKLSVCFSDVLLILHSNSIFDNYYLKISSAMNVHIIKLYAKNKRVDILGTSFSIEIRLLISYCFFSEFRPPFPVYEFL